MTVRSNAPHAKKRWSALSGVVAALLLTTTAIVLASPSGFVELDFNIIKDGAGTYDWANGGALTAPTSSPYPKTWTRAGAGGLFDGGKYNGPGVPPTAPTLTAAAAADPTIADADFLVDPLASDTTAACGAGDPTVYTGMTSEKNGDRIDTMTFSTGSVPPKDEIANVYAVAHRDDATNINEIFFGAERIVNDGDSHIDFEFFQDEITIPDNACSGAFSGHRSQGDLLLVVDFTNGGALGGTKLFEWHCAAESGTQPPQGTICDPPAHGKSVPHYQDHGTTGTVFGVNAAGPVGCGGWVCRDKGAGPTTMVDKNEFMEGGIDLNEIGFEGCISTFIPHTRSSAQFTATLKDFGGPINFDTCRPSTILSKSASPTAISVGQSVTYTYVETNDGNVALTNPSVTDDKCSPVNGTLKADAVHNTGDANDNGILDPGEAWNFSCTQTYANVPTGGTVTNTATGHGTFNGSDVTYCPNPASPPLNTICDQDERATATVTINPVAPTIATQIKLASDDSDLSNPVAIGATVYDTATLSGAYNPTGTVTYKLYTNATCTTLSAAPALNQTVNINADGTIPKSNNVTFNAAGTWYFQATYSGDTNNAGPVSSTCTSEIITVSPNNPSLGTTPSSQIRDSFAVSGLTSNATGSVTVKLFAPDNPTCLEDDTHSAAFTDNFTIGTNGMFSGGTYSGTTPYHTVTADGTWHWVVAYSGDSNNTAKTSTCTEESVAITTTSRPSSQ